MEEDKNIIPQQEPSIVVNKHKRKPWGAVLISFLTTGMGQVYSGFLKRGIIFFIIGTILTALTLIALATNFLLTFIAGGVSFIFFIFVLIDAYTCAKKQSPDYKLKWYNRWYLYVGIAFILSVINEPADDIIVEAFKIPAGSMENTILIGDYITVDKAAYGIHIPFTINYLFKYNQPQRNDVVVFRYPGDRDKYFADEKVNYIKRIIGLPGETIKIVNKAVYIDDTFIAPPPDAIFDAKSRPSGLTNFRIFPKGSGWNEDNYGPLVIPKKDDILEINELNKDAFKVFIFRDSDLSNEKELNTLIDKIIAGDRYIVKKNYYFMMGDNRNNSADSRFIGFIAEDKIIGKAKFIYFSMFKLNVFSIRWDRIGKAIN